MNNDRACTVRDGAGRCDVRQGPQRTGGAVVNPRIGHRRTGQGEVIRNRRRAGRGGVHIRPLRLAGFQVTDEGRLGRRYVDLRCIGWMRRYGRGCGGCRGYAIKDRETGRADCRNVFNEINGNTIYGAIAVAVDSRNGRGRVQAVVQIDRSVSSRQSAAVGRHQSASAHGQAEGDCGPGWRANGVIRCKLQYTRRRIDTDGLGVCVQRDGDSECIGVRTRRRDGGQCIGSSRSHCDIVYVVNTGSIKVFRHTHSKDEGFGVQTGTS